MNRSDIITLLHQAEIIACPTEGVFGLTCDPFNEHAVKKLLELKGRPEEKGLILMAANWEQAEPYIGKLSPDIWQQLRTPRTRPTTWIVPVTDKVPSWICGNHESVAIRVVTHPTAHALCEAFEAPLVSTSANLSGQQACITYQEVLRQFEGQLAYVIEEETLGLNQPSQIIEALTGRVLRS